MNNQHSRFGLNVFSQFILASLLFAISDGLPSGMNEFVDTLAKILICSFMFGIVYGFFRLLGSRGEFLEWYYQNFPVGMLSGPKLPHLQAASTDAPVNPSAPPAQEKSILHAENLFSASYLRYAGCLLIISALFSYLFKIEWHLAQKLGASIVGACVCIIGAEIFRGKGRLKLSANLFVLGFALLEFSISLAARYCAFEMQPAPAFGVGPWLAAKFLLALGGLYFLGRYQAGFLSMAYFALVYMGPLSLERMQISIGMYDGFAYTAALSLLTLGYGLKTERASLFILNTIAANAYLIWFYDRTASISRLQMDSGLERFAIVLLVCVTALYLLQLAAGVIYSLRRPSGENSMPAIEVPFTHFFMLSGVGVAVAQHSIPALIGYLGACYVALSVFPFICCLLLESSGVKNAYSNALLHAALVVSACGLFIQSNGAWSAIVFLLYSCVVLYASLVYASRPTRIYAFLVLTVSLGKLYLECSDLFSSVSGTTAVLGVGVLLMLLSYKFESVKELIKEKV